MTIGDQDHGRVSMSVAAMLAGIVHELFDLASGQVFSNCTVYSGWWAGMASLIRHGKSAPLKLTRKIIRIFCTVITGPSHPSGLCLTASATCVPHDPACDEVLPICRPDPPRVAADIGTLGACRRWHLARLALPRADRRVSFDHKPVRLALRRLRYTGGVVASTAVASIVPSITLTGPPACAASEVSMYAIMASSCSSVRSLIGLLCSSLCSRWTQQSKDLQVGGWLRPAYLRNGLLSVLPEVAQKRANDLLA